LLQGNGKVSYDELLREVRELKNTLAQNVLREIGEVKGKQDLLAEDINYVKKRLDSLPCEKHAAEIGQLKGKASTWGAITGAITSAIVGGFFWLIRKGP